MRRLYKKNIYNEYSVYIESLEENDLRTKYLRPIESPIKVGNVKVFIDDDLIYSFDRLYLSIQHLPKTLEVEFDVLENHNDEFSALVSLCFFNVRLYKLRKIHLFGDYGYIRNNLYNPYNNIDEAYNINNQLNSINRFLLYKI